VGLFHLLSFFSLLILQWQRGTSVTLGAALQSGLYGIWETEEERENWGWIVANRVWEAWCKLKGLRLHLLLESNCKKRLRPLTWRRSDAVRVHATVMPSERAFLEPCFVHHCTLKNTLNGTFHHCATLLMTEWIHHNLLLSASFVFPLTLQGLGVSTAIASFNTKSFALSTLKSLHLSHTKYLCAPYVSHKKQSLFSYTAFTDRSNGSTLLQGSTFTWVLKENLT
jgi:hypothetical protein